ncbi:MAG: hypothetical protein LBP20_09360 [Treponema sp.]|nr:hypothetical protein [Treponema sp.]
MLNTAKNPGYWDCLRSLLCFTHKTRFPEKRIPRVRGGLLAILLGFRAACFGPAAFAQTTPGVTGEASPASITAGSSWTITLLVDHPSPEDIEVRPPPLPQGLSLDQLRIEPRVIQPDSPDQETRHWTALQYRFLARNPGRIELGPFEVQVNGASALSPAFSLTVRSPASQGPRIFWRNLPKTLTAGEEALLVLCLEGGIRPDPSTQGPSLPPVPAMTIMEVLDPEGENELLSLRVIPLEGPFFSLPAFPFQMKTGTVQVPALRIPVVPAPAKEPASPDKAEPAAPAEGMDKAGRAGYPPFPRSVRTRDGIFAGAGRAIQEQSRALWEEGRIVEALAELRRNERDHPAGLSLVELRRDLEQSLGLQAEPDETYSPRVLLVPALVLCLVLAALSLTSPAGLLWAWSSRGKQPERLPGSFIRLCRGAFLFFVFAALFCLLRLSFARPLNPNHGGDSPRQALARETTVYRVPDDRGTEIARLKEGQGLLIYEVQNGWAYAELPHSGRAGWIRTGTYLVY